jgi:hypothetical protein
MILRSSSVSPSSPYMEKVPIRVIDDTDTRDKSLHGQVGALVDRILELNDARHSDKLAPSELQRMKIA